MGLYETKMLLQNKIMVTRLKRQPIEGEKIFARYISDKENVAWGEFNYDIS
jgi:hypothetical protein